MNRREFGKMVLGSGVAAAVPVSGMAGAAAAQTQRSKYIFAVALAHNRTDVSAEMISEMFKVRPSTAQGFIKKMVRNGVVDAPNADGIARLAKPLQRIASEVVEYNSAGGYIVKGRLDEMTAKAKDAAKRLLDAEREEPVTVADASDAPATKFVQNEGADCTERTKSLSPSDDDPVPPEASDAAHSAG
jgi:uncharacterized protein YutE (UPF0331/DUF86 family)